MQNKTTLPMGDFDSMCQKLQSAIRCLAFAANDAGMTKTEIAQAVYLLETTLKDLSYFQVWALKDEE
jgi:hypothetical protein